MKAGAIYAVLGVLTLGACSKKDEAVEGPRSRATATPSAVAVLAPAPSAAATGGEDDPNVVVPSDLEDKAAEEISAANLEQQLDRLEKEIGKSD